MVAETSEASKVKVLPVKTTHARARAHVAKNLISAKKATSQPEKCLAML